MSPEEILQVIQNIGQMLEPSAQAAWDIAMRQVRVETIQMLWFTVVSGVVAIACAVSLVHFYTDDQRNGYDEPIGQWIGLALSLPFLFAFAMAAYGRGANPEWYVIKWLLSIVP